MDYKDIVDQAIQHLARSNTKVSTSGELLDVLYLELGNWGRRYLDSLPMLQFKELFNQYTTLKQEAVCLSPAESNLDNELASSSYSEPAVFSGLADRSQQQHASLDPQAQHPRFPDNFDIVLVPESLPPPGHEMIKAARYDRQLSESSVDFKTAALVSGRPTAAGTDIIIRWRKVQNGLVTGRTIKSLCKVGDANGADVVFGRDLDLACCDENSEQGNEQDPIGDEGDDEIVKVAARLNTETAKILVEQKKKRLADSHDRSQGKKVKRS